MDGNATVLMPCPCDEREAASIAAREQFILTVVAAVPDRADSVNDPFGGEFVAARDFGLAGGAAAERTAFRQQFRAGGAMNGAIHPAAAEQRRVGRIHNRVHALLRDVALNQGDATENRQVGHGLFLNTIRLFRNRPGGGSMTRETRMAYPVNTNKLGGLFLKSRREFEPVEPLREVCGLRVGELPDAVCAGVFVAMGCQLPGKMRFVVVSKM